MVQDDTEKSVLDWLHQILGEDYVVATRNRCQSKSVYNFYKNELLKNDKLLYVVFRHQRSEDKWWRWTMCLEDFLGSEGNVLLFHKNKLFTMSSSQLPKGQDVVDFVSAVDW